MPTRSEPEAGSLCTHHWVIDTPNGATSEARCRLCDSVRSFRNDEEPRKGRFNNSKSY